MGFFRHADADDFGRAARKAAGDGRKVFVARIIIELKRPTFTGELAELGEIIEVVEAQGWALDKINGDSPLFICLFRRIEY